MKETVREELHAKILYTLMDDSIFDDDAHLIRFEEKNNILKAAYIKSVDEADINLCFNLPVIENKLFLTVSDGLPDKVCYIMSHLEEVAFKNNNIDMYHIVRFDDDYFHKNGRVGVILLPVSVSPALNHVPFEIEYKGITIKLYLAVFLSDDEYKFWKTHGNDELMEKFTTDNKDLISIKNISNILE